MSEPGVWDGGVSERPRRVRSAVLPFIILVELTHPSVRGAPPGEPGEGARELSLSSGRLFRELKLFPNTKLIFEKKNYPYR